VKLACSVKVSDGTSNNGEALKLNRLIKHEYILKAGSNFYNVIKLKQKSGTNFKILQKLRIEEFFKL